MYIAKQCFSIVNVAERVVQVYLQTAILILPYFNSDPTIFDNTLLPQKKQNKPSEKRYTNKKRWSQKNAGEMIVNQSVASNRVEFLEFNDLLFQSIINTIKK